ncbi:MAG TPA: hypothetical protein HA282_03825 [Nanoarchaeota archaeon]|nr:hypothetical protein [Candidatus Pacearchaeota archaeon]HIH18061.1 hypothetical protein [Nanoarchaeota archaeon]HIH34739.1 hypothetical protein [Nanoarchaeota archaeon]HIH51342.1 hypothetical protein [Nanoarchaeota archaeon]HIH66319.1 hypothetical protein [Nanoarchaeota archaeon]
MPEKNNSKFSYIPLAAIGGLALGGVLINSVNSYTTGQVYQGKLEWRYNQYSSAKVGGGAEGLRFPKIPDNIDSKTRREWVDRLESMENSCEQNLEGIIKFSESNKKELVELTNTGYEHYGLVERSGDGLKLKVNSGWKRDVLKYIDEILSGNYAHTEDLIRESESHSIVHPDIVKKLGEVRGYTSGREIVEDAINMIQTYKEYEGLSGEERSKVAIGSIDKATGTFRAASQEELINRYKFGKLILGGLAKLDVGSTSQVTIDGDFLDNNSIAARFHTHPKDDKNFQPSDLDEANTFIAGPNVLFSQSGGKLHVYLISKGKSREIYTSEVK